MGLCEYLHNVPRGLQVERETQPELCGARCADAADAARDARGGGGCELAEHGVDAGFVLWSGGCCRCEGGIGADETRLARQLEVVRLLNTCAASDRVSSHRPNFLIDLR